MGQIDLLDFQKSDMHMTKRGHYDTLKGGYVVDWEEEGDTE